jgi:hypothetical protein
MREEEITMGKKKAPNAPPPLPPAVRVAVHAPSLTEPEAMCTLADKCIAAGTANPGTIGSSPYLPPIVTADAVVKAAIPTASGGTLVAKANLLAGTRQLRTNIMAHAGWIDSQMASMTPAAASAYAVSAGFTVAKAVTHSAITAMSVTNGPAGSLLLQCAFPDPQGRCLSCTEYSTDGEKTWTRGPDTEKSHVDLPLVFTAGQTVEVRLRQFLRGSGYTPWEIFTMIVI